VVVHTYGRPASAAQSAVADNLACYCSTTRACTLCYSHSAREVSTPPGTRIRVPWYSAPLVLGTAQNASAGAMKDWSSASGWHAPLNRPSWPLHQFAKLLRLASVWAEEGAPEWLWFVDADVRVLNFTTRIEDFLPRGCGTAAACDDVGLVVVDHPWAGIVTGSFLIRRSPAGLDLLRHVWECQRFSPKLADQASLADALLTRTVPRNGAAPYRGHECLASARWRRGGWRAMTQCWNFHMARMGHPYGERSTPGVVYVDPHGSDFQAFSYHNYGERSAAELAAAYGASPALGEEQAVALPLAGHKNDAVFTRGDLLLHSSLLGGARLATPDLLDAVGSLPGLALKATPRSHADNFRHLSYAAASAAAAACLRGPAITYERRPHSDVRPADETEVFVLRRAECPDSGANKCPAAPARRGRRRAAAEGDARRVAGPGG